MTCQLRRCAPDYADLPGLHTTHQGLSNAPLPDCTHYAGGDERVEWHLKKAVKALERFFGFKPKGSWSSEGAISAETLKIFGKAGYNWTASGVSVLGNSLHCREMNNPLVVTTHLN